jgi:hypothetical protein
VASVPPLFTAARYGAVSSLERWTPGWHPPVVFDMIYAMGYRAFQRSETGFREILQVDISDFAKLTKQARSKNFWFIHSETNSSVFSSTMTG